MEILSAGTSGTSAEHFFDRIDFASATAVVDIRLHRSSQLAGFAKERDLRYFVPRLTSAIYLVESKLAPAESDLKSYRNKLIAWAEYEERYLRGIEERRITETIDFERWGDRPVLLCSEPEPSHCHRRLAAEYLRESLRGSLAVTHIAHL